MTGFPGTPGNMERGRVQFHFSLEPTNQILGPFVSARQGGNRDGMELGNP